MKFLCFLLMKKAIKPISLALKKLYSISASILSVIQRKLFCVWLSRLHKFLLLSARLCQVRCALHLLRTPENIGMVILYSPDRWESGALDRVSNLSGVSWLTHDGAEDLNWALSDPKAHALHHHVSLLPWQDPLLFTEMIRTAAANIERLLCARRSSKFSR